MSSATLPWTWTSSPCLLFLLLQPAGHFTVPTKAPFVSIFKSDLLRTEKVSFGYKRRSSLDLLLPNPSLFVAWPTHATLFSVGGSHLHANQLVNAEAQRVCLPHAL